MTHRRNPLAGRIAWFAALGLFAVVLFGAACGGSDGSSDKPDDAPITEAEATEAVNGFLASTFGLFTGATKAQEFIDLFAPECRAGADAESLAFVLLFIQAFAPDLQGIEIEEVDAGALTLEQTSEGVLVSPQDPAALRVKVDGEFVPVDELFADAGFDAVEDEGIVDSVLLVRRDGRIYIGDCSQLEDLSGGLDSSSVSPARPGSSS